MIEVKNIEKSFGESKILKGISTVLKLEKPILSLDKVDLEKRFY
jgi:ABC-type polar amino acid transport system ATPase subunit